MVTGVLRVVIGRNSRKGVVNHMGSKLCAWSISAGGEDVQRRCHTQERVQRLGSMGERGAMEINSIHILMSSSVLSSHAMIRF